MTYDYHTDWCPRCATRDNTPTLCEQCKLPHYAIVPTMFEHKQGGEAE